MLHVCSACMCIFRRSFTAIRSIPLLRKKEQEYMLNILHSSVMQWEDVNHLQQYEYKLSMEYADIGYLITFCANTTLVFA